jgi:hypothetical protein
MIDDTAYYAGGYYLIQGYAFPLEIHKGLLSGLVYTVGDVCDHFPDVWGLSWWSDSEEKAKAKALLGLSEEAFVEFQAWVDDLFESKYFGWPDVWMDRKMAQEFNRRYIAGHIPDVKLLGIGLPQAAVADFIASHIYGPGVDIPGVEKMLARYESLGSDGHIIGFDTLGYGGYGRFDSPHCTGLFEDAAERFGIQFNDVGLMSSFEQANQLAAYAEAEEVELASWFPWVVMEYPLA